MLTHLGRCFLVVHLPRGLWRSVGARCKVREAGYRPPAPALGRWLAEH